MGNGFGHLRGQQRRPSASCTFSSAQHRGTLFLKPLRQLRASQWPLRAQFSVLQKHKLKAWKQSTFCDTVPRPTPPAFPGAAWMWLSHFQHFGASSGISWAGRKDAPICWANHCPSLPPNPDKQHPRHRVNMC